MRRSREFTERLPSILRVMATRGLAFDRDLAVAEGQDTEPEGAAESPDHGPERHEGEEHQHAAGAFEISGLEDFHPGEPGAYPERRPPESAEKKPEQGKQRNLHEYASSATSRDESRGRKVRFNGDWRECGRARFTPSP